MSVAKILAKKVRRYKQTKDKKQDRQITKLNRVVKSILPEVKTWSSSSVTDINPYSANGTFTPITDGIIIGDEYNQRTGRQISVVEVEYIFYPVDRDDNVVQRAGLNRVMLLQDLGFSGATTSITEAKLLERTSTFARLFSEYNSDYVQMKRGTKTLAQKDKKNKLIKVLQDKKSRYNAWGPSTTNENPYATLSPIIRLHKSYWTKPLQVNYAGDAANECGPGQLVVYVQNFNEAQDATGANFYHYYWLIKYVDS